MIKISIDVTKIDKERLFVGRTRTDGTRGKFLSITLVENRGGKDQYGNDGFVVEDVSKQERESGVKGTILGNYKKLHFEGRGEGATAQPAQPAPAASAGERAPLAEDDIPF